MNCPNCNKPYEEHETICRYCNTPLGNAQYAPVPHKKKKKKAVLIGFLIFLIFLCIGGAIGYYFYIDQVKKRCTEVTNELFGYAHDMDFSSIDSSNLPEPLKSNPDVRNLLQEQIDASIESSGLSDLLDYAGVSIDSDVICDDIISSASYEITDVKADYHSCTITVHTSNTNYIALSDLIYEKAKNQVSDSSSSLWSTIIDSISSLFKGNDSEDNDEDADHDESIPDSLSEWYKDVKEEAPLSETTGDIVYGIQDGKWTVLSFDENLILSYYGVDSSILE